MSKNKNKKNKGSAPKPKRQPPKIPVDYILAIADEIHRMNPTREIVFNTLKELYVKTYEDGYQRHISDCKYHKMKQDNRLKQEWNKTKEQLEDILHNKTKI